MIPIIKDFDRNSGELETLTIMAGGDKTTLEAVYKSYLIHIDLIQKTTHKDQINSSRNIFLINHFQNLILIVK